MIRTRATRPSTKAVVYEKTEYFSGRTMVEDDAHERIVTDFEAQTLTTIDKAAKTYRVAPLSEYRRMADKINAQLDSIPKHGIGEQIFGAELPASLKATGRTKRILGHLAREYTFTGGHVRGTVWVTDELAQPPGRAEMHRAMAVGHPEDPSNALVDLENALGGLPLRRTKTCIFGRHTVTYDVDVVAVGSDPPPASVLSVPAGFRRVSESGSGR